MTFAFEMSPERIIAWAKQQREREAWQAFVARLSE